MHRLICSSLDCLFKDAHIQSLEQQLRQTREELERSRHHQRADAAPIPATFTIPEQPSIESSSALQRQYQETREKLDLRLNELHSKENECVTLKAKVDTYESKEKDLQHYISILKESMLIKDQQVTMIQSEVRVRLASRDPSSMFAALDRRSSSSTEGERCDH